MKMAQDVNDIVAMLDEMVINGTGHINVSFDAEQEGTSIESMKSLDCAKGDLACSVPTLFDGLDDKFADDYK